MIMSESKPQKMAKELEGFALAAFILIQGSIALIAPGVPFSVTPRPTYSESDLKEAVSQALLLKSSWHISDHNGKVSSLDVYVLPPVKK
jgi:hypothetical protein